MAAHLIAVGVTGNAPWRVRTSPDPAVRQAADECVECGDSISGWGCWYSDGLGELVPYCPSCAQHEFGAGERAVHDARTAAA